MIASQKRELLQAVIVRVIVSATSVDIELDLSRLLEQAQGGAGPAPTDRPEMTTMLTVPAELTRTGQEMQLIIHGPDDTAAPRQDRSLLRMLAQARQFQDMVLQGQGRAMGELAVDAGVSASYFTTIFRLGFLAPEIVQLILQGRQPATLTAERLKRIPAIDPSWSEQRRQIGLR